ncbi:virulence-associated protein E [Paenibacillus cellulosilyticus]|uniref:Virulence-associated protein E n=1 Tax=Paenibacillus cellulosilyticus TaxID=375489 RepID=A0A2V2YE22_9BACL|nr:virulence-associated E family protein [Paenibacillus cellulosilyticus]PWV90239.1 virulence-associated protein E [Paenibacillus cellulosilyticus]QKS43397.1 virulence protein E [Paenibacillus cellulosilyticus]
MQDVELAIAFGRNRSDTNWKNEYLSWGEMVQRLRSLRRTSETMVDYDKLSVPNKGKLKDGPAFVGGLVQGGRRKKENVESRCLYTLDVDHADSDFLFMVELVLGGYAYVIYSTHSHREDKPKYRIVIPADREMTPDEYAASSRKLAANISMRYFDKTTFDVHRLMYLPSCSIDAKPVFIESDGEPITVDSILSQYDDWTDPTSWERHPGEEAHRRTKAKMEDPKSKDGIIGAFCRHYSITGAIETFLSDAYEPTSVEDRYTFTGSSSHGGLVIYDDDTFAYSHHESDPISGREVNAFDLVRLHKFKDQDDNVGDRTNVVKLPSYQAMIDFAMKDSAVMREMVAEEFGDMEDLDEEQIDWMAKLERNKKNPKIILANARNVELILTNGVFAGTLAYDAFKNTEVVRSDLPWRRRERPEADYEPWLGADDRRLQHYIGKHYDIKSSDTIKNALTEVVHSNTFHPVKSYLEEQQWDGIERLGRLFIDYLGAEDTLYVREVTRKMFIAAIKRIYEPGCKFDQMLVLVGPQGVGKSSLLAKMGRQWFSDSLKTFDSKEAGEHLQGAWIIEIGELAAMKKAEVDEIKQFLSKESDRYRVAYDRMVSDFPRKCVFFGTTNNHNFLQDTTGNRRFWPVTVDPAKRKLNHFTHFTEELVGQVWAEALSLYKAGEALELDSEAYEAAKTMQERHMENDPREGLIAEYLSTPLPDDWDERDEWSRREYLKQPTGSVPRTRVCVAEVWVECLESPLKALKPWEARNLCDTIRRIPGWRDRQPEKSRFKLYGVQKAFEKVLP